MYTLIVLGVVLLFLLIRAVFCAICYMLSEKMGLSEPVFKVLAFVVGFFLGIWGALGYVIIYAIKSSNNSTNSPK